MEPQWRKVTGSLGLLILRLGVGGFMVTHGWGKLNTILQGQFDGFPNPIGLGSGPSLVLTTTAEFFCAILVMMGLGTRFAAAPIAFAMGVAAFVVHSADPWTMGQGVSKEPAMLYLSAFLALILTGPGMISIDELICRGWRRRRSSGQVASP